MKIFEKKNFQPWIFVMLAHQALIVRLKLSKSPSIGTLSELFCYKMENMHIEVVRMCQATNESLLGQIYGLWVSCVSDTAVHSEYVVAINPLLREIITGCLPMVILKFYSIQ